MGATRLHSSRPSSIIALIGGAVVIVAASAVSSVIGGARTETGPPLEPHVRQVSMFSSIAEMTVESDAVIRGTILEVEPGRLLPAEAGGGAFTEVRVRVDEVLFGTLPDREVVLEIDRAVFPAVNRIDRPWPQPETSTLLFLHRKLDTPSRFRPISSQGAYTVRGSDLVAADEEDPFAGALANLTESELEKQVRGVERN